MSTPVMGGSIGGRTYSTGKVFADSDQGRVAEAQSIQNRVHDARLAYEAERGLYEAFAKSAEEVLRGCLAASNIMVHEITSRAKYYSCCFSVCDGVAAQRACDCRAGGYSVSPSFGRRGSGGEGCHAGAVVVPAGACLVASPPA